MANLLKEKPQTTPPSGQFFLVYLNEPFNIHKEFCHDVIINDVIINDVIENDVIFEYVIVFIT